MPQARSSTSLGCIPSRANSRSKKSAPVSYTHLVIRETTALGACYLAGLAAGVWKDRAELKQLWRCDTLYQPDMEADIRARLLAGWDKAVGRSMDWAPHN